MWVLFVMEGGWARPDLHVEDGLEAGVGADNVLIDLRLQGKLVDRVDGNVTAYLDGYLDSKGS